MRLDCNRGAGYTRCDSESRAPNLEFVAPLTTDRNLLWDHSDALSWWDLAATDSSVVRLTILVL